MSCLFCKIVEKKLSANIIYEDEDILAFHDVAPKAPQHVLIIPKKHITTLNDVENTDIPLVGQIIFQAKAIAAKLGFSQSGYRLVMNCNDDGGQSVYHIHCHVLGGRPMLWPPG